LTTSSLDTDGQWRDIEEKDLVGRLGGGVTGENSGLNCSTVCNSLIRVDGLVGLLAVEVISDELLNSGDTSGTSDQDDFVDLRFVDLGVCENTVDWGGGRSEEILAELFETSTGDGSIEIDTLKQGVNLNGGLCGRRESTLGTFASSSETTECTSVG
jgi:hypothetical protein